MATDHVERDTALESFAGRDDAIPDLDAEAMEVVQDGRNRLWKVLQGFFQIVGKSYVDFQARGMENVPARGPGILLMNHSSHMDNIAALLELQRRVWMLAGHNTPYIKWPVVRSLFRALHVLPIGRDGVKISQRPAIKMLNENELLGIYPEGTRTRTGEMGTIRRGFTMYTKATGAPIIPVGIAGTFELMPPGAWVPRPGKKVRVVYGEQIPREQYEQLEEAELIELVRSAIQKCLSEAESWRQEDIVK